MKLGNSKTENDLRDQLSKSFDSLLNDQSNNELRAELIRAYPDFKGGCVLQWIPEQCENIYLVLTNGPKLLYLEIDKFDDTIQPIIEFYDISDYKKGLKKSKQLHLAVALEIIESKLK